MSAALKALIAGFVFFMAAAALQEWDSVVVPLTTGEPPAPPSLPADPAAAEAVRQFLVISNHLQRSGGDPRFADRLPALPPVRDELLAEATWLDRAGIDQHSRLMKVEFTGAKRRRDDLAEVRTREYWIFRLADRAAPDAGEQVHSQVLTVKYLVAREGSTWRVARWELDDSGGGS